MIDWQEVIRVVKVAPHTYRHEWGTTALELLVKRVEDDLAAEAQKKCDKEENMHTEYECVMQQLERSRKLGAR